MTFVATNASGAQLTQTVNMNDHRLVRIIGQENGAYLVRIVTTAAEFFA